MTSTPTTTVPSVWPCLAYRDARAAIRFLTQAFGFTESAVYADGDTVHHAELTWAGPDGTAAGGIMFGSADSTSEPMAVGSGTIHVVTADPDALFARATAAGATVVRELEDTDYGSRAFMVRDPEGNAWSFGTPYWR